MGRRPTRNKHLPAGMRARHRKAATYYYLDTGAVPRKEIPLGSDYVAAVQKWAELVGSNRKSGQIVTLRVAAEGYIRDMLKFKAPRTQQDNLKEIEKLYEFFDNPPVALDEIKPKNIREYLTVRGKVAKVRANREKALFSAIFNYARDKGLTDMPNPCAGIKGHKEAGRDIYIDDSVFNAVYAAGEEPLRDAMDVAYLTGQRPADVLKISRADIKDGALWFEQNKTGKKLRVAIEGKLEAVIKRITARKVTSLKLVTTTQGYEMSAFALRGAFDRARVKACLVEGIDPELASAIRAFQFRDLRAKAGTDKEETQGMLAAQDQLGHTTQAMTAHYVRHRRGKLVTPTK